MQLLAMSNFTYSVVVPCYNCADTIAYTLRSLTTNTVERFEVVVVDDGSTDGSAARIAELVAEYAAARPNIYFKLLTLPANKGLLYARCAGVHEAEGAFIVPLDADDRLAAQALDNIDKWLRGLGSSRPDITHLNMEIYKNGEYSDFLWANPRNSSFSGQEVLGAAINGAFGHNQAGKVFRRATYLQAIAVIGWSYLEQNRIVVGEDFLLTIAISALSGSYLGVPQTFYIYNQTGTSAMRGDSLRQLAWRFSQLLEVTKKVRRVVPLEVRKYAFRKGMELVDAAYDRIAAEFACADYAEYGIDKLVGDSVVPKSYRARYAREQADKCSQLQRGA